ncbi:MAG: hypothetical protein H6654_13995 [Ardenticatenaceae bacterium]|nr:hypothetical protein [Anaerolineales bacterium]MCB8938912.1 hypothetical protein [Ardenticatenaceae bacterium]MCB8974668.1 hypothetical protein [Ardenticatenaceae bacterium]
MKLKTIFILLLLTLTLTLAACSPTGGEPAASDNPATETPDPDAPVSSDDPTQTPDTDTAPEKMIEGEASVESITIAILESFPVQVHVNVVGYLGDGCTSLGEISTRQEGDTFFVTILTQRPAEAMCTQQLVGFEENIPLDVVGLPAGSYTVNVNGVTDSFTLQIDNAVEPLPGTDEEPASALGLPDAEVAELLRLTLTRALVDQEIPDYALLADQETIVLSTENIDPALLPELAGVNLLAMTPDEIQAKADAEGDFPYLRFQGFTAVSSEEVTVSLGSTWARAANSEIFYLSGGGFTITYTRTSDGWMGEVTEMWIS